MRKSQADRKTDRERMRKKYYERLKPIDRPKDSETDRKTLM